MTQIADSRLIDIPKIHDAKGNLSFIEGGLIPFAIQRVYYLYDVPSHAERLGHAHKKQQKLLVALSGSFEVVLRDGQSEKVVVLSRPNLGLYIPNGIWREMRNFSSGSICLVIASENFDEGDYVRDFSEYQSLKNRIS
jgi:hypothetical protein